MQIDCYLTLESCPVAALRDATVLVIDVLRATSTILAALDAGARAVLPAASLAEAQTLQQRFPTALLAGEREGRRLSGFDLGNSPLEMQPGAVRGRLLISCTSNGTRAIALARRARRLYLLALRNRRAVAARVLAERPARLVVLCSGTDGRVSLDDTLTAGALLEALTQSLDPPCQHLADAAQTARAVYRVYREMGLEEALLCSFHGRKLAALGYAADLRYCAELDVSAGIPSWDPASAEIRLSTEQC